MFEIETAVSQSGPVFSPRATRIVDEMADDTEEAVADYAYQQVQDRLTAVLKHPTGFYQSKVRSRQVGSRHHVDDSGVVYGPWLEDGSSRRRTKFKGYQTFRRVTDRVRQESTIITERVVQREIGRLS